MTGGRVVLTALGCGIRDLSGWGARSVPTELGGGVVLVTNVNAGMAVFKVLVWGVEALLGAGGDAVFKALIREVDLLPPAGGGGGGEAVLESFWEGLSFLPENGAGAVFTELGLEVVVVFFDGETAVFDVDVFFVVGD